MGFGREVEDHIDAGGEFAHEGGVTDVAVDQGERRVVGVGVEVCGVGGVGQLVEVSDLPDIGEEASHDVAAEEAATAGNERLHGPASKREWSPSVRQAPAGAPVTTANRPIIESRTPGDDRTTDRSITIVLMSALPASSQPSPMAT